MNKTKVKTGDVYQYVNPTLYPKGNGTLISIEDKTILDGWISHKAYWVSRPYGCRWKLLESEIISKIESGMWVKV